MFYIFLAFNKLKLYSTSIFSVYFLRLKIFMLIFFEIIRYLIFVFINIHPQYIPVCIRSICPEVCCLS